MPRSPWFLLIGILACAVRPVPSQAAHEWRAAWGSPQPLVVAEGRGTAFGGDSQMIALYAQPYGVAGLGFTASHLRSANQHWEGHVASLHTDGYREWHLGCGRHVRIGEQVDLLAGLRVFGTMAKPLRAAPSYRATLLARAEPHLMRALSLELGIIDCGQGGEQAISPLITQRCALAGRGGCIWVERSTELGAEAETVVMLSFVRGRFGFAQGYRWLVGEVSSSIVLRGPRLQLRVGERWHPELGSTPWMAVDWLGAGE